MKYTTIVNNEHFEVEIQRDGSVFVNGKRHEVDWLELPESLYSMIKDNKSIEVAVDENDGNYNVLLEGRLYEAQVLDQRAMMMLGRKGGLKLDSGEIKAPMPGLIIDVLVNVGDDVNEGDTVIILESMKMQNELKAPRTGSVQSIQCKQGDTIDKNTLLLIISGSDEE
ncbi:MAG: biotin/lipoyl-containing protein [Anaerolineae bacterium]|nr:biotin/lipoyl-containing protein [Anaerolineae bacterium]MDQ7033685.1 biotin/lipoyl-containing protein [Anaerolineae bacterium]